MKEYSYYTTPPVPEDWKPSSKCPFEEVEVIHVPRKPNRYHVYKLYGTSVRPFRIPKPKFSLLILLFRRRKVRLALKEWEEAVDTELKEHETNRDKLEAEAESRYTELMEKYEERCVEYDEFVVKHTQYLSDYAAWREVQWAIEFRRMLDQQGQNK